MFHIKVVCCQCRRELEKYHSTALRDEIHLGGPCEQCQRANRVKFLIELEKVIKPLEEWMKKK